MLETRFHIIYYSNIIHKETRYRKTSLSLQCTGQKGRESYNHFMFENQEDTLIYNKIIEKFEAYITSRKNLMYSHFKF